MVMEGPLRIPTCCLGEVQGVYSACFCSSDDEIPSSSDEEQVDKAQEKRRRPPKRKLKMEEYPEFIAKRYAAFRAYRNTVLQKWHEKTKLASGKVGKASPG